MGKNLRKLGVGLALGVLAGHYLSTEKGQELVAKVKKGLAAYQENPEQYNDQARDFFDEQINRLKEAFDQEGAARETTIESMGAEVDDIIITYADDN